VAREVRAKLRIMPVVAHQHGRVPSFKDLQRRGRVLWEPVGNRLDFMKIARLCLIE
jgi:hypothetical protein